MNPLLLTVVLTAVVLIGSGNDELLPVWAMRDHCHLDS